MIVNQLSFYAIISMFENTNSIITTPVVLFLQRQLALDG
jgi:hypothetical protein